MTTIPYQPPRREYADTLLAFRDMQMSSRWSVRIDPDPLGDVNKLLTLMNGRHRVRTVLWPVGPRADVRVGYDAGSPRIRYWTANWEQVGEEQQRPATWYVEVDGRRVIEVPEHECHPPHTPPPPIPWKQRVRTVIRTRARNLADQIAEELGYHRADTCGGWDE